MFLNQPEQFLLKTIMCVKTISQNQISASIKLSLQVEYGLFHIMQFLFQTGHRNDGNILRPVDNTSVAVVWKFPFRTCTTAHHKSCCRTVLQRALRLHEESDCDLLPCVWWGSVHVHQFSRPHTGDQKSL